MTRKQAYLVLFVIFSLTVFLFIKAFDIRLDFDFEKFFPDGDEATGFYNEHRKRFGTDNDFLLIGLVNEKGIFRQDFLKKARALTAELQKTTNVTRVSSPVNSSEWIRSTLGRQVFESPLIHVDQPEMYVRDSVKLFSSPQWKGNLVSTDAKAITIYVEHKQYLSKEGCDKLSDDVELIARKYQFDEVHISGRSNVQKKYVDMMGRELLFFTLTSFVVVVFFLWFTFRSFWGIWIPVTVVLVAGIWVVGVMNLLGQKMNILLTLLPTIIFVVGMSDVVHILSRYLDELRNGLTKTEALKKAYREVALATFLTSFTTAIGFFTLVLASVEPIRIFGIYTSIGVMLAFVLAYSVLPAILVLTPAPVVASHEVKRTGWYYFLHRCFRWVLRSKQKVIYISIAFLVLSVYGLSLIVSNNFILEDVKSSNPLRQDFNFFEEKFSGVRPFEMSVFVSNKKDSSVISLTTLQKIEKLERFLAKEYGIGFFFSPNTVIKSVNKNNHAGSRDWYRLPETQEELDKIVRLLEKFHSGEYMKSVITSDGKVIRIAGKCHDLGSNIYREKNKKLDEFFTEELNDKNLSYALTGTAHLMDRNSYYLASGLIQGLLISLSVIALIAGLQFRSWKMLLVAILPNFMPLVMIAALMGFTGIHFKVSTSMIFTIAFGIAVDDTIHFLSKLKIELAKGKKTALALRDTYLTTGKAIYITTFILSGGFLTLVFSEFLGTVYIGILVGITLLFAVVADMFLLPVLVLWIYRSSDKQK